MSKFRSVAVVLTPLVAVGTGLVVSDVTNGSPRTAREDSRSSLSSLSTHTVRGRRPFLEVQPGQGSAADSTAGYPAGPMQAVGRNRPGVVLAPLPMQGAMAAAVPPADPVSPSTGQQIPAAQSTSTPPPTATRSSAPTTTHPTPPPCPHLSMFTEAPRVSVTSPRRPDRDRIHPAVPDSRLPPGPGEPAVLRPLPGDIGATGGGRPGSPVPGAPHRDPGDRRPTVDRDPVPRPSEGASVSVMEEPDSVPLVTRPESGATGFA